MNIDALNAIITSRDLNILSHTVCFKCTCGGTVKADLLTGQAVCKCGRGTVTDFVRRVEAKAIEQEERRLRESRELMGARKVSNAKKVRGVWR